MERKVKIERDGFSIEVILDDDHEGTWHEIYNQFLNCLKGLDFASDDWDNMRME